jgi:tyrosyl-tRNA synthetase
VQQGGVRLDGVPVTAIEQRISAPAQGESVLQAGKRKFLRLVAG